MFPPLSTPSSTAPNLTQPKLDFVLAHDLLDNLRRTGRRPTNPTPRQARPARSISRKSQRALIAAAPQNVRIIVNDRPDIASIAHAAGVHVGQEDLPVEAARQLCPTPQWVGISTHNLEQLRAANEHFGGLYSRGPDLPDHHQRKSRPSSRPGPNSRRQKTNAQAPSSHRRHHNQVRRRSLPSRRRFRSHNQRSSKRARPSANAPANIYQ